MSFLRSLMAVALLLGVVGCSDDAPPVPAMGRAMMAAAPRAQIGAKLAYRHQLVLQMPDPSIQPRFDRARDLCLQSAELHCILQNATLNVGDPHGLQPTTASLSVRLPHEAVAPFIDGLLAAVPGETASAVVTSRSTQADDLTKAINDGDQRQKELLDYRERLLALAKIPDAKVDDLIKIASELSNVQSRLEAIAADQSALNDRVATEEVDVSLRADPGAQGMFAPVSRVWLEAGQLLGDSTARTLRFVILALPWLPLAVGGLFVAIFAIRRIRR